MKLLKRIVYHENKKMALSAVRFGAIGLPHHKIVRVKTIKPSNKDYIGKYLFYLKRKKGV